LEQAKRDFQRAKYLIEHGDISRQEYEQTQNLVKTLTKDLEAAHYRAKAATSDVEAAKAALLTLDKEQRDGPQTILLRAPVGGSVLKVLEESERVVSAGTPLVELSNSSQLEIVIDVLSTDAVKIKAGAPVIIEGWGESETKQARVKLIEPMAFTKVSSLGIEEQRVNVIAEFENPPETLGIGYRVEARIIVWEKKEALKIPTSALFRQGEKWNIFVVENSKARQREVEVGPRTEFEIEITKGIEDGTQVILHPSNDLKDGTLVNIERNTASQ
jgi:HlyD family secretion protein